MITVQKGSFKIVTTKQVFEEQLKPLGYQLASKENKGAAEKVAPFVKKEEVEKENSLDGALEEIEKNEEKENSLDEALEEIEESEDKEDKALDEEFGFKKGKKGSK